MSRVLLVISLHDGMNLVAKAFISPRIGGDGPEVDKVFGVTTICEVLGVDPLRDRLIYAGDDENYMIAMAWVIHQGGLAVKVGYSHIVPGAWHVANPAALVFELGNLIGSNRMNHAGARRYT